MWNSDQMNIGTQPTLTGDSSLYSLTDENFFVMPSNKKRLCTFIQIASQMIFICDQPREKLFKIDDLLDIESYPIDRQMEKLWDGNFC